MAWGRVPLCDALQKPVREQSELNAAINHPTTSQNYKFREVWLTAFETQLHSTLLPLLIWKGSVVRLCNERWCLSQLRHAKGSTRVDLSLLWPPSPPPPAHACAYTLLCPRQGHHEMWAQSKQCSHLLENVRSQRVVLCSPPKPTSLWTLWCLILETSASWPLPHSGHSTPFWLPLFFEIAKLAKACRTGSHQEDPKRS